MITRNCPSRRRPHALEVADFLLKVTDTRKLFFGEMKARTVDAAKRKWNRLLREEASDSDEQKKLLQLAHQVLVKEIPLKHDTVWEVLNYILGTYRDLCDKIEVGAEDRQLLLYSMCHQWIVPFLARLIRTSTNDYSSRPGGIPGIDKFSMAFGRYWYLHGAYRIVRELDPNAALAVSLVPRDDRGKPVESQKRSWERLIQSYKSGSIPSDFTIKRISSSPKSRLMRKLHQLRSEWNLLSPMEKRDRIWDYLTHQVGYRWEKWLAMEEYHIVLAVLADDCPFHLEDDHQALCEEYDLQQVIDALFGQGAEDPTGQKELARLRTDPRYVRFSAPYRDAPDRQQVERKMIRRHFKYWRKRIKSYELSDQDVELALWICCTVGRLKRVACNAFGDAAVEQLAWQFVRALEHRQPLVVDANGVVNLAAYFHPYPDFDEVVALIKRDLQIQAGGPAHSQQDYSS